MRLVCARRVWGQGGAEVPMRRVPAVSHERAPGRSLAQPWKWGAQVCGNRERDGDSAATRSPAEHEALSKMDGVTAGKTNPGLALTCQEL